MGKEAFHAFRRTEKTDLKIGEWKDGKMSKSGAESFALSKSRPLRFGANWKWCHVRMQVGGIQHRLLIAMHIGKQNFFSCVVRSDGDESLVLARLESHGTHPGFHLHACCIATGKNALGSLDYEELIRVPGPSAHHRNVSFPENGSQALEIVGRHLNIPQLLGTRELQLELGL
jgi:hypothetical protein